MTVALGIGGNAAVLGFMNGLLLPRAQLVHDPRTTVSVFALGADGGLGPLSAREYLAVKEQTAVFDALAAAREARTTIGIGSQNVVASAAIVTPEARSLFGLPPGDGAVIGHAFRERELREERDVTRQHVDVDGAVLPIAGVAPAALEGIYAGRAVDVWVVADASRLGSDRDSRTLSVIGHLRDGVSMRQARDALGRLAVSDAPLVVHAYTGFPPEMQSAMTRLATLMPAVAGTVFLITCANVALFLLSRAAHRSDETSLRLALGATRGALARAVLVESALIAATGAAAGILAAVWTGDVIPALLFEEDAADLMFVPDTAGVLLAAAVSAIVVLGCGMAPLLENRHDTPGAVLRRGPRRPSASMQTLRRVLVVFQMSACCALVISSASLSRALEATLRTTASERLGRPLLVTVESKEEFRRPDLGIEYFRRVEQEVRAEPGTVSAAWIGRLPGGGASWYQATIEPPGLPGRGVEAAAGLFRPASLARVVLPPKRGRMFGGMDTTATCRVVAVTEAAAAALFPRLEGGAVGRVLTDPRGQQVEIVGVVTPSPSPDRRAPDEPAIYYYAGQGDVPFTPSEPVTFEVPVLPPVASAVLDLNVVSNDYFALMGLPVLDGTLFTDEVRSAFCRIGVVNEQAAQLYFGTNAVGSALIDSAGRRTTIVGVVRDVQLRTTGRAPQPAIFVPMSQEFLSRMHLIVAASNDGMEQQERIRRRLAAVDGGKPEALAVVSLEDRLRKTALAAERIAVLLLAAASINALAIGILGLYRTVADDVHVRRREIGLRCALGAQRWRLILMVVVQAGRAAAVGAVLGITGAMLLGRWMQGVTGFEGSPGGWAWLAGPLVLVFAALVASVLPARRIAGTAPLTVMNTD